MWSSPQPSWQPCTELALDYQSHLLGVQNCMWDSEQSLSNGDSHFPFCVQPSSNTRACCWLMLGWLAATAPRSVPAELLLSQSVLSWHNFKGLFLYRCRTLHFSEVKMFKHTSPGTETCSAPLGPCMTFTALPLSAELVFYHRGE